MKAFLRWWLFAVLISIGLVVAGVFGAYQEIWAKDATKLSFVILGIFAAMSLWCGTKTFSLCRAIKHGNNTKVNEVLRLQETGWFASDLCMSIGMIGTVTGFIMMLVGFSKVDVSDVKAIQDLLGSMSGGMSTALYTTLAGLVCSSLLKIQYFNLQHEGEVIEEQRKQ